MLVQRHPKLMMFGLMTCIRISDLDKHGLLREKFVIKSWLSDLMGFCRNSHQFGQSRSLPNFGRPVGQWNDRTVMATERELRSEISRRLGAGARHWRLPLILAVLFLPMTLIATA